MMCLRSLVLYTLFLPNHARRSTLIANSRYDTQQLSSTLTEVLKVAGDAREVFIPGTSGHVLQRRPLFLRSGSRRATVALDAANGPINAPRKQSKRESAGVAVGPSRRNALAAALATIPAAILPAWADDKRVIGEITTSGLLFKDTLRVEAFTDPKVAGVELFLSDFSRPVTEKLAKGDIFTDPANVGLTCSRNGRVVVSAKASENLDGEEVFSDSKNLFFKQVKVRRLVDRKSGNLVYVAFSQRADTSGDENNSRFRNTLCAVPVDEFESAQSGQ